MPASYGWQTMNLPASTRSIVLLGWPGAGKTTCGDLLAQRLGRIHLDLETAASQDSAPQAALRRQLDDLLNFRSSAYLDTLKARPHIVSIGVSPERWPLLNLFARCRLEAGATVVWLHGTEDELRRRWFSRERGWMELPPVEFFNEQANNLRHFGAMWRCACEPYVLDTTLPGMNVVAATARILEMAA